LREKGYDCYGLDGTPGIYELSGGLVLECDLASPQLKASPHAALRQMGFILRREWGLCIEVGEHVPPELADVFLDNVASLCNLHLIMSWAVPGQRGKNHVNTQPAEWVAAQLGRRGWSVNSRMTTKARRLAGKGWDRKLTVFEKVL
jgi:hypothetical protein